MQIPVSLLQKNENQFSLTSNEIDKRKKDINNEDAIQLDGLDHALKRRSMLAKVASENLNDAFERYIGNNDLVPINYLEIGYRKSKAIGRLRFFDCDINRNAMATAFLISPDLILTNHHVFKCKRRKEDNCFCTFSGGFSRRYPV